MTRLSTAARLTRRRGTPETSANRTLGRYRSRDIAPACGQGTTPPRQGAETSACFGIGEACEERRMPGADAAKRWPRPQAPLALMGPSDAAGRRRAFGAGKV